MASNLVYTIWALFGGFILHFLLCNYLTVLLRPRYEEPVETAANLIERDMTPFFVPGGEFYRHFLNSSGDRDYQKISQKLVIPNSWDEYDDMVSKVTSTGLFALIGTAPDPMVVTEKEYKYWYRSSEIVQGDNPYQIHLANKKWPLKKVI